MGGEYIPKRTKNTYKPSIKKLLKEHLLKCIPNKTMEEICGLYRALKI